MFFGFGIFELVVLGVLFCALFGVRRVRQTAQNLVRAQGILQRCKEVMRHPLRFLLK